MGTGDADKNDDRAPAKRLRVRPAADGRWYRFEAITPEVAVLRGSYAMTDVHFKQRSRGQQAAPSSVVAIVFGRLIEPKDWTKRYVDQVLECGDKLFRISSTRNRVKPGAYLTTNLVYPEFYVEDYKCLICTEDSSVYGSLFSASIGCPEFVEGLRRFFKLNDSGVVTAQGSSVAMWRHPTAGYFYYDPSSCGPNGSRDKDGVACIMRFKKLDEMAELFLSNLDRRYDSRYCIDKVSVLRVTLIDRGVLLEKPDHLVVDENVLRALNPVDVDENKSDCTRPAPKRPKSSAIAAAAIVKEPLTITISNYSIDARFATEPLVDFKSLDTGYPYYDMEMNVPSTFKELSGNMAILHGWTHEGSEMYKGKGAQNVANCVMSIGMRMVHPVKTWLRPKLDEVLALGDALYSEVKTDKPTIKSMTAADLDDTKIKIGDRRMFVDVDLLTIVGTISSKVPSVLSLRRALEEFFLVNTNGVVECSSMAVAVWTQDDYYYMFDPRQCDPSGVRVVEDKGKAGKGKKEAGNQVKKVKGKCCVTRFADVDSLVALFLKNIDQAKKNDRFIVRSVTIVDDVPGTRQWKEFKPGEAGKTWILRGGISNNDESFGTGSQGSQGIAMPIVGLVSAKDTPPARWTKDTVDEAVRDGDRYFNWCVTVADDEDDENRKLPIGSAKRTLYVKNRKVQIDLTESSIVGDLEATAESKMPNLEKALGQFFESHEYGVVEAKDLSVAVWKFEEELKDKSKETSYYCYDANPRGSLGQRDAEGEDDEPVACVIRAVDPAALARLIETNINPDAEGGNDFAIHEVKVASMSEPMTDEEIEQDKASPSKPDLNFYTDLGEDGACLNGSFDQSSEVTFKYDTRNRQQAANALVALAMKKLYSPHLWYREVVDDILKVGDQVTRRNIGNLPEEEEEEGPRRDYLLPIEIAEEFDIGVNRVTVTLEEEATTGRIADLATNLQDFFLENAMGIFRQDSVMLPIWKEGDVFFTMDPKGRDNRGLPKDQDGTATVLWFTGAPALAASLQLSVGKPEGDFVIDSVKLENAYESRVAEDERPRKTTSGEDLWHNFPKKSAGVWELSGNVTTSDERFAEEGRNKQTAAIAVMAVIFSKAYEPRQWTGQVLDEVVISGDKLHSQCAARLGGGSVPRVNEIVKEFFISNRRIDLTIEDCVQAGDVAGKPPRVQNLQEGLEKFFKQHTSGALTLSGEINVAIWRFGDFYYALIPGSGMSGHDDASGSPRLVRFADLPIFGDYIRGAFGEEGDYAISSIDVVDWDKEPPWKYDPSPAIRPSNLPPLNAFSRLRGVEGAARAILRGGTHQGSDIFPEKIRNRQTAANCVVAHGMSVVKNPATWTRSTLDEILVMGSDVHRETIKTRPAKDKLKPRDIVRVFHVGVNVLTADVEDATVSGPVAIPPPEPEVKGKGKAKKKKPPKPKKSKKGKQARVPLPPPPPVFLEEGLKKFFADNRAGVLATGRYMAAIWKDQGVYFMYDPRSRDGRGLRDDCGTSCLMWFACMEPLYDLVFANIEDDEKYGRYEICRIIVRTTVIEPLPCPVGFMPIVECTAPPIPVSSIKKTTTLDVQVLTEYTIVDEESSVLRGTLHMNDRFFGVKSRGLQATAIAAVAIVVGLLHLPSTWTSEIVDAILKYGDILHTDSTRAARPGARTLSPRELLTVFVVGDCRASIDVHNHTAAGILHVADLTEALTLFFRNNAAGILHTANMAAAVMQHYGKFYLFDPSSCNELGRSTYDGSACVIKCQSVRRLAWTFVANCNYKVPTVYTLNAVNVLGLHFFSATRSECPPVCEKRAR